MEVGGLLDALVAIFSVITPVHTAYYVGWASEPVWAFKKRENSLVSTSTPDRSCHGLVAIPTGDTFHVVGLH
jgi:hypothetical protein